VGEFMSQHLLCARKNPANCLPLDWLKNLFCDGQLQVQLSLSWMTSWQFIPDGYVN